MLISRFAPSPTGALHLGHAYSAVQAQIHSSHLRLRIDDLDSTRSRDDYITAAQDDLAWLGLSFEGAHVKQSQRGAAYQQALARLRDLGLSYPCFCSRSDIAAMTAAPHRNMKSIYPGQCRGLSASESAARMLSEDHCWRLDIARALEYLKKRSAARSGGDIAQSLRWYDKLGGWRTAQPQAHGDIILARKDALASYHLASTLDDADMEISLIVRGADLIESTDIHILLQKLLDLPQPSYHHHALVCDKEGRRLAKRDKAAELSQLRGLYEGAQLAALLAQDRLPSGYKLAV